MDQFEGGTPPQDLVKILSHLIGDCQRYLALTAAGRTYQKGVIKFLAIDLRRIECCQYLIDDTTLAMKLRDRSGLSINRFTHDSFTFEGRESLAVCGRAFARPYPSRRTKGGYRLRPVLLQASDLRCSILVTH